MRGLRLLIVIAGVALLLVTQPAAATFPGDNGRILYFRLGGGAPFTRTMLPDGNEIRRVDLPNDTYWARWSPDGSKIVYAEQGIGEPGRIAILDTGSNTHTEVLDTDEVPGDAEAFGAPTFSPDGTRLAICVYGGDPYARIFTVGVDGSDLTLISGSRSLCNPDWSSTDRIVAVTPQGTPLRIFTMDPDGTAVVRVAVLPPDKHEHLSIEVTASWSPDGSLIAFNSKSGLLRSDIWIMEEDGSDLRNRTQTPLRWERTPVFAPEGTSLVAWTTGKDLGGQADLILLGVNGGRTRLTDTPGASEIPADWQAV